MFFRNVSKVVCVTVSLFYFNNVFAIEQEESSQILELKNESKPFEETLEHTLRKLELKNKLKLFNETLEHKKEKKQIEQEESLQILELKNKLKLFKEGLEHASQKLELKNKLKLFKEKLKRVKEQKQKQKQEALNQLKEKIKNVDEFLDNERTKCFENKYSTFLSTYFNSILDILIKNTDYGEKISCIVVDKSEGKPGFQTVKDLIFVNINSMFLEKELKLVRSDANYAGLIAHELAHVILKHTEQSDKLAEQLILKGKINYKNDETYKEEKRQQEIQADKLGLKLYLEAGFRFHNLKTYLLKMDELFFKVHTQETSNLSKEKWDFFKELSEPEKCIERGEDLYKWNKLERFEQFMDEIQYYNDKDETPTGCWRYWYFTTQVRPNYFYDDRITNTLYWIERYIPYDIEKQLSNTNFRVPVNLDNLPDPRIYAIEHLFIPDINGPVKLYSKQKDIGYISVEELSKDDDVIFLRAVNLSTLAILYSHKITPEKLQNELKYQKRQATLLEVPTTKKLKLVKDLIDIYTYNIEEAFFHYEIRKDLHRK